MNILDQLAKENVGLPGSPFFVTIVDRVTNISRTLGCFLTQGDAEVFASFQTISIDDTLIIEGPSGVYTEISNNMITSFMPSGVVSILTPEGKAVVTTH